MHKSIATASSPVEEVGTTKSKIMTISQTPTENCPKIRPISSVYSQSFTRPNGRRVHPVHYMQENQKTDPLLFHVWNKKKCHKQEPTRYWHNIMNLITKPNLPHVHQPTTTIMFESWNKKKRHKRKPTRYWHKVTHFTKSKLTHVHQPTTTMLFDPWNKKKHHKRELTRYWHKFMHLITKSKSTHVH